ncbi:MAG: DNA polymerase III subunit chi [Rhizobiaceae bacterium]|nr:DNA polymerase III subunit chi [Rhizobiaceae bacterium]
MTEILFYHLTQNTFQQALPGLLERCLEREWKVTIQLEDASARDQLNDHLWTYRDDSFLPHGAESAAQSKATDSPESHPIWLTTTTENPNDSSVRFLIGGAVPGSTENYDRLIYLFDGHDEEAVSSARERWKIEKKAGHELTYWQQDEEGRWRKAA